MPETGGTIELTGAAHRGRNLPTPQLMGVTAMLLVAIYDAETWGKQRYVKHSNRHRRPS